MFGKISQIFKQIYDNQIDGTGLAIFRIVFCTVQLLEILQLFYFRHLVYDVVPFVVPYEVNLGIPLAVWAGITVLLILGLFTRTAAIINYIFTLVFMATCKVYPYHMFYVYQCVGILFIFLPISRVLSIDRLLLKLKYSNTRFTYQPPTTVSQLCYYVLVVVGIAFVYFDSTLYKLVSPLWMKGLGMWLPASLPFAAQVDASPVLNNEILVKFFGYLSLVFEFVFLFLLPFKKFRWPLIIIGVVLHLGILIAFPIPLFAIGFGALYILMIPVGCWKRWFSAKPGKEKLTFYYDAECPLCARARLAIEHFDIKKRVKILSVQANAMHEPALKGISEDKLLNDIHSVDSKGKVYRGIDTYIQVFNAINYLKPLSWLIRIPGIYHICAAIYSTVARNRTTERCTEDNCGYVPPNPPQNDDHIKLFQNLTLHKFKRWGAAVGVSLLIFMQLMVSYSAPVVNIILRKSGFEATWIGTKMKNFALDSRAFSKILCGIVSHDVFMDFHFNDYTQIVAVTYTNAKGVEQFLPITRETGQPGLYQYGPFWVNWAFRVVSGNPDQDKVEKGIKDYTAFWAGKNGMSLNNVTFKVKVKHLDPINNWEPDFLRRQIAHPWQDAGTVQWTGYRFLAKVKPISSF